MEIGLINFWKIHVSETPHTYWQTQNDWLRTTEGPIFIRSFCSLLVLETVFGSQQGGKHIPRRTFSFHTGSFSKVTQFWPILPSFSKSYWIALNVALIWENLKIRLRSELLEVSLVVMPAWWKYKQHVPMNLQLTYVVEYEGLLIFLTLKLEVFFGSFGFR